MSGVSTAALVSASGVAAQKKYDDGHCCPYSGPASAQIQAVQLARFEAGSWELLGDIMHAESS